jgi:hypothetical protein
VADIVHIAEPVRDKGGRFLKGASGNPRGKSKGTVNRSTRALREALKRAARKAVRTLTKQMNSSNEFVQYAAAKYIADRSLAEPDAVVDPFCGHWVEYLTDDELEQVKRMKEAAMLRMPDDQRPAGWEPSTLPVALRVLPTALRAEQGEDGQE